jgi:hypothetical protein
MNYLRIAIVWNKVWVLTWHRTYDWLIYLWLLVEIGDGGSGAWSLKLLFHDYLLIFWL